MGLPTSNKGNTVEHISHGVMVIHNTECLFLEMDHTYEYKSIVSGVDSGAKLYHYLSLITQKERNLLLEDPLAQWSMMFGMYPMPELSRKKLEILQEYLPQLYKLIPMNRSSESHLLTIPKGRSNKDESSIDTAVRELHEETGILVTKDQLFPIVLDDKATGTDGHKYITHTYALFLDHKPDIKISNEFDGFRWIDMNDPIIMKRQYLILKSFIQKNTILSQRSSRSESRLCSI